MYKQKIWIQYIEKWNPQSKYIWSKYDYLAKYFLQQILLN